MKNGDTKVLHSKEKDGFPDSDDKLKKITDAIEEKVGSGVSSGIKLQKTGGGGG